MIRLNNWHHVAGYILEDVITMQNYECLYWEYKGKEVRLHIPTMFIIGDIEGHDKICTRKSGHGPKMAGVTHSCNIERSKCDNPNNACSLYKENEIFSLQDIVLNHHNRSQEDEVLAAEAQEYEQALVTLNKRGFYGPISNAFRHMKFGENPNGLHGAVAICLLHTYLQKFPNLCTEAFLNLFGVSEISSGSSQINLSLPKIVSYCSRQSDRDFPKLTSFSFSLTKGKHTYSAQEKYARVFAIYIFCMTSYGWNFVTTRTISRYDGSEARKVIQLLQHTLTMYQYLHLPKFDKNKMRKGRNEVSNYLFSVREVLEMTQHESDRNEEKRTCTFPKYHYLTHVIPMKGEFGSTRNFNGEYSESHHKWNAKSPSLRTQGRDDIFDEQTCFNLSAQIMLDKIARKAGVAEDNVTKGGTLPSEKLHNDEDIAIHSKSSNFSILLVGEGKNSSIAIEWDSRQKEKNFPLSNQLRDFILKSVFQSKELGVRNNTVQGFTDLYWKQNIIRAHPNFRGKPWMDYVNIKWSTLEREDQYYYCPAKVLMFLDFSGSDFRTKNHESLLKGPLYVIVHSTATSNSPKYEPTPNAMRVQKMRKSKICRFWTMENEYHLLSVRSIESLAFVIPDYKDEEMTSRTEFVIEFESKHKWAKAHF